MQVAAGLLASTHDGIASIAVGYASEAAFNRAFKKLVGVPPASWRRRRAGQPQPMASTDETRPLAADPE
jgi:AraC-like DNA-binding protein